MGSTLHKERPNQKGGEVMAEDKQLAAMLKGSRGEVLRIMETQYKGEPKIDVRVWYRNHLEELKPGRQGISFTPDEFVKFIELIREVREGA